MTISDDERRRRADAAAQANASAALEGYEIDPDTAALQQRYVRGEIGEAEMIRLAEVQSGLREDS
ncbi:hypothetical protein GCM10025865_03610 [Paraoerskovia sediminicola]|uniref:Antitoxin VbhA domain-containing protein n=1 Tax=Paraoerskovia sediminicola TaxID=1138587 RepID=A0ABN6X8H0_9CELL|nr:hypothetical protein [Paraoerskovia sediminicola]BDZ41062.1 hypothetical protein GCM10025865_03610 [Paraoerskovia sediminicola]